MCIRDRFSGVPWETGLAAASAFSDLVAADCPGLTPAQAAIAWCWQQPGVTTVIPGARHREQALANAAAGAAEPLDEAFLAGVRALYDERIRPLVHDRW